MLALAPDQLTPPLASTGGLRNRQAVEAAIATYRGLIASTKKVNAPIYSAFAKKVTKQLP
jgi:hypothetical protein